MDIIKEIKERSKKLNEVLDTASVIYAKLCGDIEYLVDKDMCARGHEKLEYVVGCGVEGGYHVISIDVYNCNEFTLEYYYEMFNVYEEELRNKLFPNRDHSIEIYWHKDSKCERNIL